MARIRKLRLVTLLTLFFDATILLIFIAQAFVIACLLICGYLPIPSEWGNQIIAKKLSPGIILRVDAVTYSHLTLPTKRIVLTEVFDEVYKNKRNDQITSGNGRVCIVAFTTYK
mgnify:CR=1 FL=1